MRHALGAARQRLLRVTLRAMLPCRFFFFRRCRLFDATRHYADFLHFFISMIFASFTDAARDTAISFASFSSFCGFFALSPHIDGFMLYAFTALCCCCHAVCFLPY